jgi:hypothetical protein
MGLFDIFKKRKRPVQQQSSDIWHPSNKDWGRNQNHDGLSYAEQSAKYGPTPPDHYDPAAFEKTRQDFFNQPHVAALRQKMGLNTQPDNNAAKFQAPTPPPLQSPSGLANPGTNAFPNNRPVGSTRFGRSMQQKRERLGVSRTGGPY